MIHAIGAHLDIGTVRAYGDGMTKKLSDPRPLYVVAGQVRGQIYSGHSLSAAVRAVRIDRRQCASLGGGSYSDVSISVDGREMRESYDTDDGATDTESVWIAPS